MSAQEPGISFRELLGYTDLLAQRWLKYFKENPGALAVDVGGTTGTLQDLVTHIFQVETFFSNFLLQEQAVGTAPPAKTEAPNLDDLEHMHQDAHDRLAGYLGSASPDKLEQQRTLGRTSASNRKVLAQTVLHSVHHWAQVAMEVRQAGFPAQPPQDIIIAPVMK